MKMAKPVRSLKLPLHFDAEKLRHDLAILLEGKWIPHFNTRDYQGNWKVIPLYAFNGDEKNIFAFGEDQSTIKPTPLLEDCLYFQQVINTFHCPILSARILKLGAGSEINPHRDHLAGYEYDFFRLHIPIQTNDEVRFILDGELLHMLAGECWYTNVHYVHSVSNHGNTDRVHLVIDGERNEWSDQLFFSLAPKEHFLPPEPSPEESPERIRKIIENLKWMDSPASQQLIEELQSKLRSMKEG